MNRIVFLSAVVFFVGLVASSHLAAQTWPADTINTKINTSDPKFPFPQFKEYNQGKTLALYNSEGVTHADMEKTMREGYKIMMHRGSCEEAWNGHVI